MTRVAEVVDLHQLEFDGRTFITGDRKSRAVEAAEFPIRKKPVLFFDHGNPVLDNWIPFFARSTSGRIRSSLSLDAPCLSSSERLSQCLNRSAHPRRR
jgi:hypothetical protein